MPHDTPPPMDPVEEYQNNQLLDEDDFVVVDDSDLSDSEEFIEADDSRLTFSGHSGPVFCCNISSKHGLAVSGGEDDKGFVWDMSNGKTVFECTGHEDSVTSVGFNHDSSLVATGDMSGIIQVWDVQSKERLWDFKTSDLKWLQWLPESNFLMAGTVCGDAWLWHVPDGDTIFFPTFGFPSSVGKFMTGGKVVIGYDDGSIRIWDHNNAVVLQSVVGHAAHKDTVTSVDCDQTGLILTGSVDGTAKLILAANGRVLNTFQCRNAAAAHAEELDSVESVAFLTALQAFVTCTVQGSIAVWDIGSHVQRLYFKQECGVVKVICPKDSPMFFTAGLDGVVRLFDGRTGQMEASWKGHVCEILDFDLTSDGQTLITASQDSMCKVFSVGER